MLCQKSTYFICYEYSAIYQIQQNNGGKFPMKIITLFISICVFLSACQNRRKSPSPVVQKASVMTVPADSNAFYFPLKKGIRERINREQSFDSFINTAYSQVLFHLKEPILYNYSGAKEIYRFIYLPSMFNFPVSMTIREENNDISMSAKVRYRLEGYHPITINIDTTLPVSSQDWDRLHALLEKSNFWKLPADTGDSGVDGFDWILEGTKDGNYHFLIRWSPGEDRYPEINACCKYVRSLAVKSVDFHHQF
jgi:hypothetical protein